MEILRAIKSGRPSLPHGRKYGGERLRHELGTPCLYAPAGFPFSCVGVTEGERP
jgi:hypothetical protein